MPNPAQQQSPLRSAAVLSPVMAINEILRDCDNE